MLTSTKLGKALGLTKGTIGTLARQGRIPFIQLPSGHRRFDLEAVKAALSADAMASTFLSPISECSVDDQRRILRDIWWTERKKIEAVPLPKFDRVSFDEYEKEFEKHTAALTKLDDEYIEADARLRSIGDANFDEGAK